jgi:Flp pilus assembly protein CpaB
MNRSGSRSRNLALATVFAVVAAILTLVYTGGGGNGGADAASGKTVPVLFATRDLPVGTYASQALADGSIVLQRVPAVQASADALATAAPLHGEVVVQPIFEGEQVTARRFGPTGTAGAGSALSGSLRLIQVAGDPQQLLAGTLQDGDHVDVVGSVRVGSDQRPETAVALRNVLVVHAPAATATGSSTSSVSTVVQLTDAQAQKLFFLEKNGDWSFALRPARHVADSTVKPTTASSIFAR